MNLRHKLALAVTVAFLTMSVGCADLLTFDLNAQVTEFVVYGDSTLHQQHIPLDASVVPAIAMPMTGMNQGTIHLSSLLFYVTETGMSSVHDDDDLEFMTAMDVFVTPTNPNTGLPTVKIASWNGPAAPGEIVMDMVVDSEVDLSDYVAVGFSLKVGPAGVVPMDNVTMKGEMTFSVNPF